MEKTHARLTICIWNFFFKKSRKLKNNPRLWTAFSNIKNMSEERKKQIENDSKEFMKTI